MTQRELTERYLSDTRAVHTMFENGMIDSFQHEEWTTTIDNRFFDELDMLALIAPSAALERILQHAA